MRIDHALATRRSHWLINPTDSRIAFTVEYLMMTTAEGTIRSFSGAIDFDESDVTRSSVEVTIDAGSIETDDPSRDAHLRSADFFDVAHFPTITFKSRGIRELGGCHYEVRGDLTIRGITREVALPVTFQGETGDLSGCRCADFSARATINATDFGLTWNRELTAGWIPVGDRVTVVIQVEATAAG